MSIICGTDLSPASASALDVAVALAKLRGDREVVLVHVASEDDDETVLEKSRLALVAQAEAARAGQGDGVTIRPELIVGPPDEAIVNFADVETSDLIVIAARSRRESTRTLPDDPPPGRLGSAAGKIVARTQVPVIAIRDPAPWLAFARKTDPKPLRILLGMDDSAVCDLGIQWTHRLRQLAPVEVVLGAIYYPDDAAEHYGISRGTMVDRNPEIETLMTRDLVRRFGGDSTGVDARPRRGLGRLGDHVLELAREENVDAIVVGTGQKTGLGRLGSVSSIIVNDAPQSVVCVPPQAQIPTVVVPVLRAALVATDLSQFSNRAIPYAFAACEPDADIHIVHIVDDDDEVDVADITRQLYALAPTAAKQKVTAHVVRGGDAAITVAQTAARLGVDVICMCSHGRSGITRALMGSTADRVLRVTRLPVLVLRPA
ncbi:MAG: universal stress protein [Kofleriaceae bacterium]